MARSHFEWFRMYCETYRDPKIIRLSDKLHRFWVNLLCLAGESDGILPNIRDIAVHLRLRESEASARIVALMEAGLIDDTNKGLTPHSWSKRQYKSDVSTERVKRFRNGLRNATETLHETHETSPDTDTDTDTELNTETPASAVAIPSISDPISAWFESEFWPNWIKRTKDVKEAALIAAKSKAKTIAVRAEIMAAVQRIKATRLTEDPEFRISARRWLRECQWKSEPEAPQAIGQLLAPFNPAHVMYVDPFKELKPEPKEAC